MTQIVSYLFSLTPLGRGLGRSGRHSSVPHVSETSAARLEWVKPYLYVRGTFGIEVIACIGKELKELGCELVIVGE